MTVVWGTVQDHHGYIEIGSREVEGTVLTLYLPVTRAAIKDRPTRDIKDFMGRGETIIVVDDVDLQRDIATRILTRLGYSVLSFASGEEAVEYMKDHSADLMVLDMIMDPGIDGLETYRRVLEYHPGQKVIIASGYSETKQVRELQKLGAGAYIKKPYLIETLGLAIRTEMDKPNAGASDRCPDRNQALPEEGCIEKVDQGIPREKLNLQIPYDNHKECYT